MDVSEPDRIARKYSIERLESSNLSLLTLSFVFILLGIYFTWSSLLLDDLNNKSMGLSIGLIIIALTAIFFISPMLTPNFLTRSRLIIRYGLLFKLSLPLNNISKAEEIDRSVRIFSLAPIGTKYSSIDRRYSILRSRNGMVKLSLKESIIVGFPKKMIDEIVIDCFSPDVLIRRIKGDEA